MIKKYNDKKYNDKKYNDKKYNDKKYYKTNNLIKLIIFQMLQFCFRY